MRLFGLSLKATLTGKSSQFCTVYTYYENDGLESTHARLIRQSKPPVPILSHVERTGRNLLNLRLLEYG